MIGPAIAVIGLFGLAIWLGSRNMRKAQDRSVVDRLSHNEGEEL